jgi:hypothetical protein
MKSNRIRTAVTALAATACMAIGVGGIATAGAADGTPKVTIHYTGDGFEGKIKNERSKCLKNRTVVVKSTDGQYKYTDTTETDGSWSTGNSGQVSGSFKAIAKATDTCGKLVSKTISIP